MPALVPPYDVVPFWQPSPRYAAGGSYGRLPPLEVGTGGSITAQFIHTPYGYKAIFTSSSQQPVFAKLVARIKQDFGRTMSALTEVFGVSRQTIYNWLAGEIPKDHQQHRIIELAKAGNVFAQAGLKLTTALLQRNLTEGKSFLQLIAEGHDGEEAARKLVRVVNRGRASLAALDGILGQRNVRPSTDDFGPPSLQEEG